MKQLRGHLLILFAIGYIFYSMSPWINEYAVLFLAIAALAACVPGMSRAPQMMAVAMFASGQLMFYWHAGDWSYWKDAFMKNLPIVLLFLTTPLLSIPLRIGGYIEYMSGWLQKFMSRRRGVHVVLAVNSTLLSCFMNMGAIRVMHDLFGEGLNHQKRLFVTSVVQGFALAAIFSPYIAGVVVVLNALGLSILPFMFYALVLVVIGHLLSALLGYRFGGDEVAIAGAAASPVITNKRPDRDVSFLQHKGIQLVTACLAIFVTVIALSQVVAMNLVVLISIIAIVYTLLWVCLIGNKQGLKEQIEVYRSQVLPNIHNESVLLVAAGFFSQMVQFTSFSAYLSEGLGLVTTYSLMIVILLMLLMILALAMTGIHQIIPITLLALTVSPADIGLQPELFAVVLCISWPLSSIVSPVGTINIVGSRVFEVSSWHILKWNWTFVVLFMVSAAAAVSALNSIVSG